jgi:hypothetical protein
MNMENYRHTEDMGEISGFGGGYEKTCQDMLENGVKWLTKNSERRDLKGHSYEDVYGIMVADSDDAKEMEKAMMADIDDCTGAMHQAVMSRLFFIAKNGWEAYCAELREHEKNNAA